jgi:ArsR family transcriptional regulator
MPKTLLAVASHVGAISAGGKFRDPHAISALSALAQSTRLAIFRLLMKHEPAGLPAGVIAETVGAPHNTLSSHLAIMVRAGLLRSSREGRTIIYRSDLDGMQTLLSFLVNDCCDGHPELCNLLAPVVDCGYGLSPNRALAAGKPISPVRRKKPSR